MRVCVCLNGISYEETTFVSPTPLPSSAFSKEASPIDVFSLIHVYPYTTYTRIPPGSEKRTTSIMLYYASSLS